MLTNRVKFITHSGRDVMLIDSSNASEEEELNMLADVNELMKSNISKAPFLLMGDFTNVSVNVPLVEKLKGSFSAHRKYIKKYAAVGVTGIAKVFANVIIQTAPFEICLFKTREEALEWLVK